MVYTVLVLIHVLCAVIGIGATFVFSILMNSPKNLSQLKFSLSILKKLELFPKIGGTGLLLTGLIMGFMHPDYFKEVWYTGSLVLYFVIQIFTIGVIGSKMKNTVSVVMATEGEEIPSEYHEFLIKTKPYHLLVNILAILIIILMTIKPF